MFRGGRVENWCAKAFHQKGVSSFIGSRGQNLEEAVAVDSLSGIPVVVSSEGNGLVRPAVKIRAKVRPVGTIKIRR